jgi:cell division septation protein DedD
MFQSGQAITIAIFYFIMFIIVSILTFKNLEPVAALKALAPFLVMILLLIYDTDCLVTGGCGVYSWIRTVMYLLVIIGIIYMLTTVFFVGSAIASAVNNAEVTATATPVVTTTTPPATTPSTTATTTATTTPTTAKTATTATPATTEKKTDATTPTGTAQKTTEKFASWEGFEEDVYGEEEFTQMF